MWTCGTDNIFTSPALDSACALACLPLSMVPAPKHTTNPWAHTTTSQSKHQLNSQSACAFRSKH